MGANKEKIKIILEDLYAFDSSLRAYEAELEKIVCEVLEFKPETEFDEAFRRQLRQQLLARARELGQQRSGKILWRERLFSRNFSFALVGGLAVIIVLIGAGYLADQKGLISFNLKPGGSQPEFNKISLGGEAFGPLTGEQSSVPGAVEGRGGGGGLGISGSDSASSATAPPGVSYKYVYRGEPLELSENTVEVLRRRGFDQNASALGGLLDGFGLGLVNLSNFSQLKMQNINFVEDKDLGYLLSVSLPEGMIYISENWPKWPQPFLNCREQQCFDNLRLKISEVLPDEQIIELAQNFVRERSISLVNYGQPEILEDWRAEYEKSEDKNQFYIPEVISVVYPLQISGWDVFDEGGRKTGLAVSVNIREKKVSGVGNITSQSYESSRYTAETDASKIIKSVEQGGGWYYYGQGPGAEAIEIELGTPRLVYESMTNFSNGRTNFLLVPSLIFPVIKGPPETQYYYQKNIIVPLAKELLDSRYGPLLEIQ